MIINVPAGNYPLQLGTDISLLNTANIYLQCRTSLGAVNIILPRITQVDGTTSPWGFKIFINDVDNNAAVNNITITPNPADKINGVQTTPVVFSTNGVTGNLQVSGTNSWDLSSGSNIMPQIIALPKVVSTVIVIGNNQIGLSAGGFTLSGIGSVTTSGNGYIVVLPLV